MGLPGIVVPPKRSAFLRNELQAALPPPGLRLPDVESWRDHVKLRQYDPHPHIPAPVAV